MAPAFHAPFAWVRTRRSSCLSGGVYPILLNTIFGVRSVDPRLFEAASMLGCTGSAMFRQIVMPASMPAIFNGLRLGHGFAWILIVVGEMTGVPTGLGSVIMDGRTLSRTDLAIVGMIVIGVLGFLTDRLIVKLNNRVLRWSPQHQMTPSAVLFRDQRRHQRFAFGAKRSKRSAVST